MKTIKSITIVLFILVAVLWGVLVSGCKEKQDVITEPYDVHIFDKPTPRNPNDNTAEYGQSEVMPPDSVGCVKIAREWAFKETDFDGDLILDSSKHSHVEKMVIEKKSVSDTAINEMRFNNTDVSWNTQPYIKYRLSIWDGYDYSVVRTAYSDSATIYVGSIKADSVYAYQNSDTSKIVVIDTMKTIEILFKSIQLLSKDLQYLRKQKP